MSTLKSDVLAEMDSLIVEGHRLDETYALSGAHYMSREPEASFHTLNAKARAAIARIAGTDSEFYRALPRQLPAQVSFKDFGGSFVAQITGALEALRHSVAHGLLVTLESRLRANVYDDFLVQAKDLLDAGYHVAAMALVGGVFVMEAMSVILQVWSFKTRGKRIFRMAPIHHHFELAGWHENQVIVRFWIMSLAFAMLGLATLKLR
jgi:hypothetical protein